MEAALVRTASRLALVLVICQVTTQTASAQRNAMAIGHSVGRYLGYGWTKGGYQAGYANHQYPIVKQVARNRGYVSNGLHYPYSPGYRPIQHTFMPAPTMMHQVPGAMQHAPSGAQPTPAPKTPAKPTEPPPEWLKQYLDGEQKGAPEEIPAREEDVLAEPRSPSDIDNSPFRFKEELKKGLNDQLDGGLGNPADDDLEDALKGSLEDDDLLLDSDDDDLLLESDDFTYRRWLQQQRARIPSNRYKQAYQPQQPQYRWRK